MKQKSESKGKKIKIHKQDSPSKQTHQSKKHLSTTHQSNEHTSKTHQIKDNHTKKDDSATHTTPANNHTTPANNHTNHANNPNNQDTEPLLSPIDKKILTILDDAPVKDFVHFARRFIDIETEEIRRIADCMKEWHLVEIVEVADSDDLRYEHTKKVEKNMLDDELFRILHDDGKERRIIKKEQ